ncbi:MULTISPECIES: DUF2971 domain-containing protein [unclassified Paracoccus (in: a-proteobacteria)]|uniref:DUF2971 domain-containing protein n=1 Tax=unclassified Paracoccus (in: a-proteobacteria) TaxID=2688777 RepID=UPI0015FFAA7B|nr:MULTISPECIES: DUF2971 domain-containing protein [unclassified Paracoccus (in: a-proteobacteria)]MBB1491035.1 DUF2971 domain-containing protein [Paracoccus sp. MC1854]MBB1497150.1 DUF2971 domain-containing protein [Paracoccus sp. MC1862]QQO44455.1 DUF2971 domain-containing protein [Paracoccus sp. MC1862]
MEGTHRESAIFEKSSRKSSRMASILAERDSIGIASFSECRASETMWAHYAGEFHGITISYRFKRLVRSTPNDIELVRVTYDDVPPVFLNDRMPDTEKARLALSTKTLRWGEEREWRLLSPKIGLVHFDDPLTVAGVTIGVRFERKRHLPKLLNICRKANVKLYEANISGYQLEYTEMAK